jgi:hypothetical protein
MNFPDARGDKSIRGGKEKDFLEIILKFFPYSHGTQHLPA